MSNTNYTEGPWAVVFNTVGLPEVVKQRLEDKPNKDWTPSYYDAGVVSGIGDHTDEETSSNQVNNAHLIAAAPELYEMLEFLSKNSECDVIEMHSEIEELLAKARGEQS